MKAGIPSKNKVAICIDKYPYIFVGIFVLVILIVLNQLSRLFLAKPPSYTPAVIEQIYGKDSAEDYKVVISEQWLGQKYSPFVEYVEKPREGKFVNVTSQGIRCHYSSKENCIARGGTGEIWIFGGSTTFGYGVKDNETIAANLSKFYPDFRVINFGSGGYYSAIELIEFENLLAEFPPPRAAVFIDGLNDFYYFGIPNKSMYSDAYTLVLDKANNGETWRDGIRKYLEKLAIYRLFSEKLGRNTQVQASIASDQQLRAAIARLGLNHSITETIGDKLGVAIVNVIQPVPLYGIGHKTSKVPQELLNYGDHVNSGAAYKMMFGSSRTPLYNRSRTLNLANLGIEEGMYVDTVHYSAQFNKKIAFEISKRLSREIK